VNGKAGTAKADRAVTLGERVGDHRDLERQSTRGVRGGTKKPGRPGRRGPHRSGPGDASRRG
jgi:hypothetical protein